MLELDYPEISSVFLIGIIFGYLVHIIYQFSIKEKTP